MNWKIDMIPIKNLINNVTVARNSLNICQSLLKEKLKDMLAADGFHHTDDMNVILYKDNVEIFVNWTAYARGEYEEYDSRKYPLSLFEADDVVTAVKAWRIAKNESYKLKAADI